jgi:hypothetical protein
MPLNISITFGVISVVSFPPPQKYQEFVAADGLAKCRSRRMEPIDILALVLRRLNQVFEIRKPFRILYVFVRRENNY